MKIKNKKIKKFMIDESKRIVRMQVEDVENGQIAGAETTMIELIELTEKTGLSGLSLRKMLSTLNEQINKDLENENKK